VADWKDLLESTVSSAKAVGEGLRHVANEAQKVAGIGVGELAITLSHRAHRGETLHGTVRLELPEPIDARCLMLALRARRARIPVENLRTQQATPLELEDVFDLAVELAGAQRYASGSFAFAIDIPDEIPTVELEGLLGQALRAARAFKSLTHGELRWRLVAWLEIPWKRNLQHEAAIVVNEARPRPKTAPPPTKPPPRPAPPRIPRPVPLPGGWTEALDACLRDLGRSGFLVIHCCTRPPVDPRVVMEALARHPDLEPELLQFYGVMDGLEVMIGRPRQPAANYEVVRLAKERAASQDGWLGECSEPYSGPLGDALVAEIADDGLRVLEIPRLAQLLDEATEQFVMHHGRQELYGAALVGYGDYYGLVRGETIRAWQHAPADDPRQYTSYGERYGAALTAREREHACRWWVVRGDDHGAGLKEPALVLRWSEMLGACLDHLAGR
jgi:hypothetical protein